MCSASLCAAPYRAGGLGSSGYPLGLVCVHSQWLKYIVVLLFQPHVWCVGVLGGVDVVGGVGGLGVGVGLTGS